MGKFFYTMIIMSTSLWAVYTPERIQRDFQVDLDNHACVKVCHFMELSECAAEWARADSAVGISVGQPLAVLFSFHDVNQMAQFLSLCHSMTRREKLARLLYLTSIYADNDLSINACACALGVSMSGCVDDFYLYAPIVAMAENGVSEDDFTEDFFIKNASYVYQSRITSILKTSVEASDAKFFATYGFLLSAQAMDVTWEGYVMSRCIWPRAKHWFAQNFSHLCQKYQREIDKVDAIFKADSGALAHIMTLSDLARNAHTLPFNDMVLRFEKLFDTWRDIQDDLRCIKRCFQGITINPCHGLGACRPVHPQ